MYKKREIENYLIDIKEKIAKIKSKSKNKKLQDFLEDEDLEIIVEHSLMIIGEAISKIPQEILSKRPEKTSSSIRERMNQGNLFSFQFLAIQYTA